MSEDGTNDGQGNTGAAGEGEQTSFLDGIQGEELRGNEGLSSFENLDSLAQGFVDLKASQPATIENAEGYTFELSQDVAFNAETNPNGIQIDPEDDEKFKAFALENQMQPELYQKLMEYQTNSLKSQVDKYNEQLAQAGDEAVTRRKESLGANYDQAVNNSLKAMAAFGAEDLKDNQVANDDKFFNMMSKIGAAISEGKLNAGSDGGGPPEAKLGEDGKKMLSFPSMEKK